MSLKVHKSLKSNPSTRHAIKVSDGSRVIVTILEPTDKIEDRFLSEELEDEDVEFVRACRGRLAKQLQTADD